MDPTVFSFAGQAVGLGLVTTLVTQIIKVTQEIPWLSKFAVTRWILEKVAPGKDRNIQIFVVAVATILNVLSIYAETGTLPAGPTIIAIATTFLTALGSHDAVKSREIPTT